MLVVFDLDETLADTGVRTRAFASKTKGYPHFDADVDWDAYFKSCGSDLPIVHSLELLKALHAAGHDVCIWTGRGDAAWNETVAWLKALDVPDGVVANLHMRKQGDVTPDVELKASWAKALGRKPDLALDDRDSVVRMWRDMGVPCFQVRDAIY
jgi:phosphoglycolate phosphatase-like HAD superfamily hydrolase